MVNNEPASITPAGALPAQLQSKASATYKTSKAVRRPASVVTAAAMTFVGGFIYALISTTGAYERCRVCKHQRRLL
jgi:hypothetical protein